MDGLMNQVWDQLLQHINIKYMLSIILLSYFIKRNFGEVLSMATGTRWKPAYTVLIIASALAVPFMICTDDSWEIMLLSYAMATSLYELIFEWIEKKFRKNGEGG